jgi:hypothetical protein
MGKESSSGCFLMNKYHKDNTMTNAYITPADMNKRLNTTILFIAGLLIMHHPTS